VGDGTASIRPSPVRLADLPDARLVTLGARHACALAGAGDVYCWGENDFGQLGDGTTKTHLSPARVEGLPPVDKMSSGRGHTCVETTQSPPQAYCWGQNDFGQIGIGTTNHVLSPVLVPLPGGVEKISAGGTHTCAVLLDQTVQCWGRNNRGQLGVDQATTPSGYSPSPVPIAGLTQVERVYGGDEHTCGRTSSDTGICWGSNVAGQLGSGMDGAQMPDRAAPAVVSGLESVGYLSMGNRHTCAFLDTLGARCWGANDFGQLNLPDALPRTTPVPPEPLPGNPSPAVAVIEAGGEHACAIAEGGAVFCWGLNDTGQLGNGAIGGTSPVVRVRF
jgi:alpha-tubulin suppressor-like RCC1 family protein